MKTRTSCSLIVVVTVLFVLLARQSSFATMYLTNSTVLLTNPPPIIDCYTNAICTTNIVGNVTNISCTNFLVCTTNYVPTSDFLPPTEPPVYPTWPLSDPPVITPAGGPDIPPQWEPPTAWPANQGIPFCPNMVVRFSMNRANGGAATWDRFEDSVQFEDGDTVNLSFDPLRDHMAIAWPAFIASCTVGGTTATATAMMPPHSSMGSWTLRITGTNPLTLSITNVACRNSIGVSARYPSLVRFGLPKGANAVNGAVQIPIMVAVTNGGVYALEYRLNYEPGPWTLITNITADPSNTDANGMLNFNMTSGGATNLFIRMRSADNCSSVIGYSTIVVQAGKSPLLANQFVSTDTRVPALFAGVAAGSYLVKIADGNRTTNLFDGTSWTHPEQMLTPGGGAIFHNGGSSDVSITFAGIVMQGGLGVLVGTSGLRSYVFPKSCLMDQSDFPAQENDMIYKYSPATDTYDEPYTFVDGAWSPSVPEIAPNESFAVVRASTNVWTVSTSPSPVIKGVFGPEIYDYMYNQELPPSSLTAGDGSWDTSYLLVHSNPGITWDVQTTEDIANGIWTTEAVAEVGLSQLAVVQVPTNGRQQLCYRLKWPSEGMQQQQRMMAESSSLTSKSIQQAGKSAGMIEELQQLVADVEAAEAALVKTNYYLLSLGADGPPVPGNLKGLPEIHEGNITVIDDRAFVKEVEALNQGKAAAVFAKARRNLAQPLPAWLQKR